MKDVLNLKSKLDFHCTYQNLQVKFIDWWFYWSKQVLTYAKKYLPVLFLTEAEKKEQVWELKNQMTARAMEEIQKN